MTRLADNRIRELRTARKWSMRQLAERINTSATTVSDLETGEMQLTLDYMRRCAAAFGVSTAEILQDKDLRPVDVERRRLGEMFDSGNEAQREQLVRVAEAVVGYNAPPSAESDRKAG